MAFLRSVKGCIRSDNLQNYDNREELNIFSMREALNSCRHKWIEHVNRMPDERLLNIYQTAPHEKEKLLVDHGSIGPKLE
jgi:hypothetical protein